MNHIAKLAFLVGTTQATPAACTTSSVACISYHTDATCTTANLITAQAKSQTITAANTWTAERLTTTTYPATYTATATAGCYLNPVTGQWEKGMCDLAASGGTDVYYRNDYTELTCTTAASPAIIAASKENLCQETATGSGVYRKLHASLSTTDCISVKTGATCTSSFFNCGASYSVTACPAANKNNLTQPQSEALAPAVQVDCLPASTNADATTLAAMYWTKGNCAAAVTNAATGVVTSEAQYDLVKYSDATCETVMIASPLETASSVTANTCTAVAVSGVTTWYKYQTSGTACAYVSAASYTSCPVRQNFFTCADKFSATGCAAADAVEQTEAESNYTARVYNEAMINTCTQKSGSTTLWENGVCDTTGYSVKTFLDSACVYEDPATAQTTAVAASSCQQVAGSTTEWAQYETDVGQCTFTAAQQYGAKPFMMAASAALVAAASMF